jgi:hypothetical protein
MSTVASLREAGHDAVHLRDEGLLRMEDSDILDKARSEECKNLKTHEWDNAGPAIPIIRECYDSQSICLRYGGKPSSILSYLRPRFILYFVEERRRGHSACLWPSLVLELRRFWPANSTSSLRA